MLLLNFVLAADMHGLRPIVSYRALALGAATVIRIVFALLATQLLAVPGLQIAGGLLLL